MIDKKTGTIINPKVYIGIDCGVDTGIAVWVKGAKRFDLIQSTFIHRAFSIVFSYYSAFDGNILVRIEDARLRTWIPKQKNEKAERGRREGAGSVKRDAKIWEDYLTDNNIPFELVPPKDNKTKMKSSQFKIYTGWEAPTNEHARDAAWLVFKY